MVRRKLAEWLKKKKKFDEDREKKRIMKIEELLEGMGITYDEATRAAGIIQVGLISSRCGSNDLVSFISSGYPAVRLVSWLSLARNFKQTSKN